MLNVLRAAYQGDIVGQSYEGNRVFNVITILDEESRNSVAKVADLPLRTPAGNFVLLHQIADVYQTAGRYQVQHLGGQRVQAVTANVIGRDVTSFVAAGARGRWRTCSFPTACIWSSPARRRRRRRRGAICS